MATSVMSSLGRVRPLGEVQMPSEEAADESQSPAPFSSSGTSQGSGPSAVHAGQSMECEQFEPTFVPPEEAAAALQLGLGATEIWAEQLQGQRLGTLVAKGRAQLRRDDLKVTADQLDYDELADKVSGEGNVRVLQGNNWMQGQRFWMNLLEREGQFQNPEYKLSHSGRTTTQIPYPSTVTGRGHGSVLYFEGDRRYRLRDGTWSTCLASNPDWYLRAKDLAIDYNNETGVARSSTLVFKGVPIFWWPYLSFPLTAKRQSGFLTPSLGMSNRTGLDVSVPYYWNIAPNYDATIVPRYMGRRGVQLGGEFRYLKPSHSGEIRAEWLPKDNVTGKTRTLRSWQHRHFLLPRVYGWLDLNAVSDKLYFEELSSRLSLASQTHLLRQAGLTWFSSNWWHVRAKTQRYQALVGQEPHRLQPQLLMLGRRQDLPLNGVFSFSNEYVAFTHPNQRLPAGRRLVLHPQAAFPFMRPGYYLSPRFLLHYSRYALDRPLPGGRDSITRTVPMFSLDGGLFFEREARFFGKKYLQTLEPRLFYVRVPYRKQDDIPIFDTKHFGFGPAQLYAENRYIGEDRIGDADQLTFGVTSRLLDPVSGGERVRASLGQRLHFADRRVTLNQLGRPQTDRTDERNRTDLLMEFKAQLRRDFEMRSFWQYNPEAKYSERLNLRLRYQPSYGRVVNLEYRDIHDVLRNLDISLQWPLQKNLYGVARVVRSLKESRTTETLGGIEYTGGCGCWVLRLAGHRFVTSENRMTNALFFQLEFSGLGAIGPSPINLLRRSVPGYGKINEPIEERFFPSE